jgi:hypothetical protein
VVPASIVGIDPSAFSGDVWRKSVRFQGAPLFLIDNHFLRSVDSTVLFRNFSDAPKLLIGWNLEVIGDDAFHGRALSSII